MLKGFKMRTLYLPSKPEKFVYADKIDKDLMPAFGALSICIVGVIMMVLCGDMSIISVGVAWALIIAAPFITVLSMILINVWHQNHMNKGYRGRVKEWEQKCVSLQEEHKIKCAEEFIKEVRNGTA
ncbi:putative membrane protein [Escherichia phage UPEC07]|nr:putative membrane protein [Escherichia phage UPEC07]